MPAKRTDLLEKMRLALRYISKLADGTYFNFAYDGSLQIEASTQADVKTIRRSFRGVIWKKEFQEYAERWKYTGVTRTGVKIVIHGVSEGPPQCKMVEEIVMEERSVPIGYKKEMVEVKKVRYICPENDKS